MKVVLIIYLKGNKKITVWRTHVFESKIVKQIAANLAFKLGRNIIDGHFSQFPLVKLIAYCTTIILQTLQCFA